MVLTKECSSRRRLGEVVAIYLKDPLFSLLNLAKEPNPFARVSTDVHIVWNAVNAKAVMQARAANKLTSFVCKKSRELRRDTYVLQ